MTIAGTTVEVEFTSIVVNVPFVVGIQTSGIRAEVYVKYGSLKQLAVQDVDYALTFPPDLLSFTITPLQPLLDKIAISGPNVVYAGRKLPLTSDFDNDDAFVRDKLVQEFERVWMGVQQAAFELGDLEDLLAATQSAAVSAQQAAASAAAALVSEQAAAASAAAAAASAAAALASQNSASTSASTATTQATNAANSASAAATSASNAAASATTATTQAGIATTKAGDAATAAAAAVSAGNSAALSAQAADTSEANALASANAAAASASAAATSAASLNIQTPGGVGNAGKLLKVNAAGNGYDQGTTLTAANVPFTPSGNIAATNVQAAIAELDAEKGLGFKNRIINGSFAIDQRLNGAGVLVNSLTATYGADRWWGIATAAAGAYSITRLLEVGSGEYYLQLSVTTADAALAAGDTYYLGHSIEGLNIHDLAWGQAAAKQVVISFEVLSKITGTFPISIRNSALNRSWLGSFTVSVADVWEKKTITVPGDTTGTWLTTNGVGLHIAIGLGIGSTYQGAAGWQAGHFLTLAGMTNLMATNANYMLLRTFQLERGNVATEFERRPYGLELALCQRYYEVGGPTTFSGNVTSGGAYLTGANFATTKRVVPTLVMTHTNASGFPAAAGTNSATVSTLVDGRTANATVSPGFYQTTWAASAEL